MKKRIITALALVFLLLLTSCAQNDISENNNLALSADELFGKVCTASEALEAAKESDVVVAEDLACSSGRKLFESFVEKVNNKEEASVIIAQCYYLHRENTSAEYYEAEKDNYPMLFFTKIDYDGEVFRVSGRKCTEPSPEYREEFKYLRRFTSEESSFYDPLDRYVLTDDDTVTWDEIMNGMVSSQFGDAVKHYTLFTDKR